MTRGRCGEDGERDDEGEETSPHEDRKRRVMDPSPHVIVREERERECECDWGWQRYCGRRWRRPRRSEWGSEYESEWEWRWVWCGRGGGEGGRETRGTRGGGMVVTG